MSPTLALVSPALVLPGAVMFFQGRSAALPEIHGRPAVLSMADQRIQQTFVWTLAHELRQPLAVVSTALGIVSRDSPIQVTLRATEIMERQLRQMSRMVEDLVDAARLSSGKVSLRLERLDLRALLREATEDVAPAVAERLHILDVSGENRALWVNADAQRLHQVFSNLLRNAIYYTEPGGRIGVTVEAGASAITVRVLDSGRGIGSAALARVFDLFSQTHPSAGGIGLSVVREIVALHVGTIEARSDGLGRGSEFIVVLPRIA